MINPIAKIELSLVPCMEPNGQPTIMYWRMLALPNASFTLGMSRRFTEAAYKYNREERLACLNTPIPISHRFDKSWSPVHCDVAMCKARLWMAEHGFTCEWIADDGNGLKTFSAYVGLAETNNLKTKD